MKLFRRREAKSALPVTALSDLRAAQWSGAGVLGPEAFPADPFLAMLADYGSPHGIVEHDPHHPQVELR